jgi:amidase
MGKTMNHHFIPRTQCQRAFERLKKPVLEIDPGDIVTFETSDAAYERLWRGESPDEIPDADYNIVTGPVAVRGAEPGDSLRIEILDIQIHRAWAVWIPDYGPLGDLTDRVVTQPVPMIDGRLILSDRLRISLAPMIGCIGLAPVDGSASTLEPAHWFGGNLDLRELSPGATLLLPVQTPSAWLSLGDLHAAMGAGEPAHLSLEAAGAATVRVSVEKQCYLGSPRICLSDRTLCVSVMNLNGTLEQAAVMATRQAFQLLTREFLLTPIEAYAYLSACVELKFGGPASPMVIAVVPHPDLRSTPS